MCAQHSSVRLAEVVASLSIATDLAIGHPMERALRVCLLTVRLGEAHGLTEAELRDAYYVALLRFAGCAADARHRASLFGDEIALGVQIDSVELWQVREMLPFILKHAGHGDSLIERGRNLANTLATGVRRSAEAAVAHCEVAQAIAARLQLSEGVTRALDEIFERWDGKGVPGKRSGESLSIATRASQLAQDAELFHRLNGLDGAIAIARKRSGGLYDPKLVETFCHGAQTLLASLDGASVWEDTLAREPGCQPMLVAEQLDDAMRAIADFADLRLPWMAGHATAVAELAGAAAKRCGLSPSETDDVRWAGFVHDVGMCSVSVSVLDKPGKLSEGEWERVRLHPYFTERVLARCHALAPIGGLAALHHERMDSSGYPRRLPAALLTPAARILIAAVKYQSLIETRPYREAFTPDAAAEQLRGEAREGKLDGEAVDAVLACAGHIVSSTRHEHEHPAGLSEREVEVLRLVAHGLSNKQMAQQLTISPATVDHHIRHIYNKIGCSTRAAAAMFALQHRLV